MQMASKKQLLGETTAAVALIVDAQVLVGNVGDSKALLWSEKIPSGDNGDGNAKAGLQFVELTKDHHPDRDDEKARIIASGGFVSFSGMPRVNGILAVSRTIGDSLSPREVSSLLQDVHSQSDNEEDNGSSKCLLPSLVECIVNKAFEKGSTDILSVTLRTL
ncbi:hypothetical protein Cgig2_004612 [Carnegiea gigantea]|uniref:PPM-type phosphatase domain-containing protein n=1 Tax=Carnegiea gigantea TaxID=171969 RepID=A0A9Q1QAI7_9CARY|nr:hypothetical protein Cgig2_004612 [Carnegiea gigantea]